MAATSPCGLFWLDREPKINYSAVIGSSCKINLGSMVFYFIHNPQ